MKATGHELKQFYYDLPDSQYVEWENGCLEFHDDEGEWRLEPTRKYELRDIAEICEHGKFVATFEAAFKKWKKALTVSTFLVEVPKERKEEFLKLLASAKFRCR